jgi:hypothetical protein
MTVLVLPWFIAAEEQTPGFLKYYIIGEHWLRFTQTGWSGDLYGSAHSHTRGTIWLYWLLAFLPWSLVGLVPLIKNMKIHRSIIQSFRTTPGWTAYLLVWSVSPMIFFTFAGNILWTYVLPGMPAFAILLADLLYEPTLLRYQEIKTQRRSVINWIIAGISIPLIFAFLVLFFPQTANEKSQKVIASHYIKFRPDASSKLVYLYDLPYSAEFYTNGNAIKADDLVELSELARDADKDCFAVNKKMVSELEAIITNNLIRVGSYNDLTLLCEKNEIPTLYSFDESSKSTAY